MPSTIGLLNWSREAGDDRHFCEPLATQADGDLTLPAGLLAQAGLNAGEDIICEVGPTGLRLTADPLRKVYVEVTSACNLTCTTCIRNGWQEPLGHMPLERFRRLLAGLPAQGPVTLSLSGFGEPLVHGEFLTIVQLAREQGVRVEIITNGTLLDRALARELVALQVAQVTVSMDGGDESTYVAMRGHEREPAVAAVAALVEARRSRRGLDIGLAFVATCRNIDSLPALLAFARKAGIDFVSISNVAPHTPEMAAELLWQGAPWVASFPDAGWRPRVGTARIDLDERTRPAVAAIWDQAATWPPPGSGVGPHRNDCRFVREGMLAVAWDGRVAPCLSLLHTHPEYVNSHWKSVRSYAVGHVDDRPLADIWRDAAYRDFRARVRAFEFSPCFSCGGCPDTDTNETDCYGSPFPACGECLWAQGIVLCP